MTDDNNDRAEQTPPPLVPPPARLNDLPRTDDRRDSDQTDTPVFIEPGSDQGYGTDADRDRSGSDASDQNPAADRGDATNRGDVLADADARDLGRDDTTDARADDDSTPASYAAPRDESSGESPVDESRNEPTPAGYDTDSRDPTTPDTTTRDATTRDATTPDTTTRDSTTPATATDRVDERPADPAYEERTFDEPGTAPEPVASVDGRDETTSFATAEPPAVAEPVEPASDRTEQQAATEPEPVDDPYARYAQGGQAQQTPASQETAYAPEAQYTPTAAYPPAPREFVQPPVEPKKKGNRGVGSLIALLSVILFAVLYAAIAAAIIAVQRPQDLGEIFVSFVQNPLFYIPAAIFVVAFVIVVLLANRASWWAYVLGSLLVGALVYFGTIGAALITANIYAISPSEASAIVFRTAIDPFVITAGLVAREVSLWTGAAISARGRRMRTRNATARAEYERASEEHRAEYERPYPLA